MPKFAAGGLLIGSGIGLLVQWFIGLGATPSWSDRAVSVLILATICFVGILEGIVVGIVAACLFFVIRSSRIDAVRVVSSGRERRSVVERSEEEEERLSRRPDALVVYELQGSLFFGSVAGVASRIRDRLIEPESPVGIVIVDFARVSDIDSSAFAALAELAADISEVGAAMFVSGLAPRFADVLTRTIGPELFSGFHNLDAALEQAEDELLASIDESGSMDVAHKSYPDDLLAWFSTRSQHACGGHQCEFQAGDALIGPTRSWSQS